MATHDFINFPAKLLDISARTWLLMGEVQAAVNSIMALPLPPFDHDIFDRIYLAKALHGTTAIEGNTLSELEVLKVINEDVSLDASKREQLPQIQNMIAAFAVVAQDVISGDATFSPDSLNRYHRAVLKDLADEASLGVIRAYSVEVGAYLAPPPEDCKLLLAQYCAWLNDDSVPSFDYAGYELSWSIVKAVVAHVYFAWIHPYSDGNGRLARLIEQALLLRAGLPPVVAHVPSYVYSTTRLQYYAELQKTHGEFVDGAYPATGNLCGFIEYALAGIRDELERMLQMIGHAQLAPLQRDHVRRFFPETMTAAQQRRLRLATFLLEFFPSTTLNLSELFDMRDDGYLPDSAQSDFSLDRDVESLIKMGVLDRVPGGYQANPDILTRFIGDMGIVDS